MNDSNTESKPRDTETSSIGASETSAAPPPPPPPQPKLAPLPEELIPRPPSSPRATRVSVSPRDSEAGEEPTNQDQDRNSGAIVPFPVAPTSATEERANSGSSGSFSEENDVSSERSTARNNQIVPLNGNMGEVKDQDPPTPKKMDSTTEEEGSVEVENITTKDKKKKNCCIRFLQFWPWIIRAFSDMVQRAMSRVFYQLGRIVARFPMCFIVGVIVFSLLCGIGLLRFTPESRAEKLWVPQDSEAMNDKDYYEDKYGKGPRINSIIITNGDALQDTITNSFMTSVFKVHAAILAISVTVDGTTYDYNNNLCFKPDETHCNTISVLDSWDFDSTALESTDSAVKNTVDSQTTTWTGATWNADRIMQGRSGSGTSFSATVLKMSYQINRNEKVVSGEIIDPPGESWERKFIEVVQAFDGVDGMRVYVQAEISFSEEFGKAISGDIALVGIGYVIIIFYASTMLGRCDCRNFKGTVALGAVASVGLSILTSYGLCSAFGIIYGPVQSVLPFLLLGIGVDDAFVIMVEFEKVDKALPVQERIGRALEHAGVSITLTSVTDFVAFAIGGFTVLPALQAFCLFAAVGILVDFAYQVTFFVAVLALDTRRQKCGAPEACPCCTGVCIGKLMPESLHDRLWINHGMDNMAVLAANKPTKMFEDAENPDMEQGSVESNGQTFTKGYRVKPFSVVFCLLPCLWPENFDDSIHRQHDERQNAHLKQKIEEAERGDSPPVFEWNFASVSRVLVEWWFVRTLHKPNVGEVPISSERRAAIGVIKHHYGRIRRRNRATKCAGLGLKCLWHLRPLSGKWFHRVVHDVLAPAIMHPVMKPLVLLFSLVVVGVGIYGTTQLGVEFTQTTFIPDGSYLLDYIGINDKYFSFGPFFNIIFKETDAYARHQSGLFNTIKSNVEAVSWVQSGTTSFWYTDYVSYANTNSLSLATEADFYTNLQTFLNANTRYKSEIIFASGSTTNIVSHKFTAQYKLITKSSEYVPAMDDVRAAVKGYSPEIIAYSFVYINWESLKVIEAELIQNMCLAIAAVFVIALFLNGHPWVAVLVTLSVGITIMCMMGYSALWGLSIDSVFVINVVVAIGLSVDYSAHIGHAFMVNVGTKHKRALHALQTMGEGVLNGAISTFLAVLMLAFSKSYVFRVFFVQLFLVVVFGVFNGLVVLPPILSYVGPASASHLEAKHNKKKPQERKSPSSTDSENVTVEIPDIKVVS